MDIEKVRSFVGDIKERQMKHIDSYVGESIALFLPVTGHCGYAVTKNHTHPSYSFIITPTGLSVSGSRIDVDSKNTIISMSPGFPHHEDISDGFTRYFALCIKKEFFENIFKTYSNSVPYLENHCFKEVINILPTIKQYMSEIRDKLPGYKRQAEILEERITHLIARNLLGLNSSVNDVSHRLEVDKIIEYIHSNYMNKISASDLAHMINFSPSNFSRVFKSETGMTLSSYIIKTRLDKGKKMIEEGLGSFTDIAYNCGFSSPAHFSSLCKKELGYTPSEYKKYLSCRNI